MELFLYLMVYSSRKYNQKRVTDPCLRSGWWVVGNFNGGYTQLANFSEADSQGTKQEKSIVTGTQSR